MKCIQNYKVIHAIGMKQDEQAHERCSKSKPTKAQKLNIVFRLDMFVSWKIVILKLLIQVLDYNPTTLPFKRHHMFMKTCEDGYKID